MSPPKQKPGRSKQDYVTPRVFWETVKGGLGIKRFAFDLAASADNTVARYFFHEGDDALSQDWGRFKDKGWCWLNPPYAHIEPWVRKCWEETQKGCKIAVLLPAAVGSNWFRDWVHGKATLVCFLNGRLAFIPDKPHELYPKDNILALFDGLVETTRYAVWDWREP